MISSAPVNTTIDGLCEWKGKCMNMSGPGILTNSYNIAITVLIGTAMMMMWVTCEEQQWEYLGLARSRKLAQRDARQPGQQVNTNKYYGPGLHSLIPCLIHRALDIQFTYSPSSLLYTIFATKCSRIHLICQKRELGIHNKTKSFRCLLSVSYSEKTTSDGFISKPLKREMRSFV